MRQSKRKQRRVDFVTNIKDQKSLEWGLYGKTRKATAEQIGYTPGQIAYRQKLAEVSPLDWRNAVGSKAELAIVKLERDLKLCQRTLDNIVRMGIGNPKNVRRKYKQKSKQKYN